MGHVVPRARPVAWKTLVGGSPDNMVMQVAGGAFGCGAPYLWRAYNTMQALRSVARATRKISGLSKEAAVGHLSTAQDPIIRGIVPFCCGVQRHCGTGGVPTKMHLVAQLCSVPNAVVFLTRGRTCQRL